MMNVAHILKLHCIISLIQQNPCMQSLTIWRLLPLVYWIVMKKKILNMGKMKIKCQIEKCSATRTAEKLTFITRISESTGLAYAAYILRWKTAFLPKVNHNISGIVVWLWRWICTNHWRRYLNNKASGIESLFRRKEPITPIKLKIDTLVEQK